MADELDELLHRYVMALQAWHAYRDVWAPDDHRVVRAKQEVEYIKSKLKVRDDT